MISKPIVGMKVRLNDRGIKQIFGNRLGMSHMKTKVMTLTYVDKESMTSPEITYIVEVDDLEINQFMIDNWCFDQVGTEIDTTIKPKVYAEPITMVMPADTHVIDIDALSRLAHSKMPHHTGPIILEMDASGSMTEPTIIPAKVVPDLETLPPDYFPEEPIDLCSHCHSKEFNPDCPVCGI